MSDCELELHFNGIAGKSPSRYDIDCFDTTDFTESDKVLLQAYIDKWNSQLGWAKSSINNNEGIFGDLPDNQDDGVCPIVSDPYFFTEQLRKSEHLHFLAEKYRRKSEYFELMATYEAKNV